MNAATATKQISKHLVRAWLARRASERRPPPGPEEIRRQMGWAPAANNKK